MQIIQSKALHFKWFIFMLGFIKFYFYIEKSISTSLQMYGFNGLAGFKKISQSTFIYTVQFHNKCLKTLCSGAG